MNRPKVSIILPCFNSLPTLPTAVSSVLCQTFTDWELIVIDDGSDDESHKIVRAAADSRIKYLRLDRNRGQGFARQIGLEQCQGDYISFVDADDWLYPTKLEKQLHVFAEYDGVSVVSCTTTIMNDDDKILGVGVRGTNTLSQPHKSLSIPFPFPSSMILAKSIGDSKFRPEFKRGEDADFLLQFIVGQKYFVLNEALYAYRNDDTHRIQKKRIDSHQYYRKRVRNHIRLSRVEGVKLFVRSLFVEAALRIDATVSSKTGRPTVFPVMKLSPTNDEIIEFDSARSQVRRMAELLKARARSY